jgi:hypothetical protein
VRLSIAMCLAIAAAGAIVGAAAGSSERAAGALELNGVIGSYYKFDKAYCPEGVPSTAECVRFAGEGTILGLGAVKTTYTKVLPGNDESCIVIQNTTAEFTVAGKGTLEVSRAGKICTPPAPFTAGPYTFTVTRGTGAYAGASGTLTFRSSVAAIDGACQCGSAHDTWTGTIVVPGLEFDVTAPTISGAVSRTVRAPKNATRTRVRYAVTAADAVDGSRPVACSPRSGSPFRLGRTQVTCESSDSSGNTARARFTITVKRSAR